jgi:polyribonucleotide nucleotidyltransferase
MDFKVAGTEAGLTSLQMDIKIQGITIAIMKQALEQAKGGRLGILTEMNKAISEPNKEVGDNAPKMTSIRVPVNKIREIIGSGGKVIKNICEVSGAKVDINDDGEVKVSAIKAANADKALAMINEIIAEPEVGVTYDARVLKILDFGAVAEFGANFQGLVHVSEIAEERVEKVEDYVKLGDTIKIKVVSIDKGGKVRLSMKQADGFVGGKNKANSKDEAKSEKPKKEAKAKKPALKKEESSDEKVAS